MHSVLLNRQLECKYTLVCIPFLCLMQEYQPISQIVYKLKIYCPYLFLFSLFYNFYREKKVGVISFYKYQKLMVSTNY
jgi:hypothetical protein